MTEINTLYNLFENSTGITTDTRNIKPKNIFWALKGENFDGNTFALEAITLGASAAIVDDENVVGEHIFYVKDSLKALQTLATFHRNKFNIPVIGITGSNGKTTTKELIHLVLQKKYCVLATIGNLNNHIGVPLTLLRLSSKHDIAVIEMGANHIEEIAELSEIARPTHGIITNIGKAHIGEFGGFDNIIYAKTHLYHFIAKNNGTIFLNIDDDLLSNKAQEITKIYDTKRITYGTLKEADYTFELISAEPFVKFIYDKHIIVDSHLIGSYNFSNIMTAFAIGKYFGVEDNDCKTAIEAYSPQNNRSQIIKSSSNTIIMDAYNANPTSMAAALLSFAMLKMKHKVAILGDMFELGDYCDKEHALIIQQAQKSQIDIIVLVGSNFGNVSHQGCLHFNDYQSAKKWYLTQNFENTAILVKGSRSMQLEKIFD